MIMQVLHIFWFYLFIRMGMHMIRTGEQKDLVNTIDKRTAADDKKSQ